MSFCEDKSTQVIFSQNQPGPVTGGKSPVENEKYEPLTMNWFKNNSGWLALILTAILVLRK